MSGRRDAWLSLGGLGRLLTLAALLALILVAGHQAGPGFGAVWQSFDKQGGAAGGIARRMITYRLDPDRPTLFRFAQPVGVVRIMTHPILASGTAGPGESWVYSVRVELLDDRGAVFETHVLHERSLLFEASGKRRGPELFHRGDNDLIAPPDEIRIASARPFAAIRLVSGSADPEVVAVEVRVGERRPLTSRAAESAFVRLNLEDRARLAAASAFPPELLNRNERVAIAVNQWRPVGPAGIDGRDYRMQVLYQAEDQAGASEAELQDDGMVPETTEGGG